MVWRVSHAFDGVQVFVCKAGARLIDMKAKEETGGKTNKSFGSV